MIRISAGRETVSTLREQCTEKLQAASKHGGLFLRISSGSIWMDEERETEREE